SGQALVISSQCVAERLDFRAPEAHLTFELSRDRAIRPVSEGVIVPRPNYPKPRLIQVRVDKNDAAKACCAPMRARQCAAIRIRYK
ncbi:MAG: hypothetical protein ACR2PO_07990, partial [Methyloligellaceae bacterium]